MSYLLVSAWRFRPLQPLETAVLYLDVFLPLSHLDSAFPIPYSLSFVHIFVLSAQSLKSAHFPLFIFLPDGFYPSDRAEYVKFS